MNEIKQRPILAASAAVFRGLQVLLVRRGNDLGKGLWSLPGGKVEFGEKTEAAALRELREETGVRAYFSGLVGLYDVTSPLYHYCIACYGGTWLAGEPVAGSDAAEAVFVELAELGQFQLAPQTHAAIVKARSLL